MRVLKSIEMALGLDHDQYVIMTKLLLFLILFFLHLSLPIASADDLKRWNNQTVYVPLYSHIYADERYKDNPFLLTATLSIRNTDPDHAMILLKVDYYDSTGALLQAYLDEPLSIAPLASTRYIVRESESRGGSGAKFLVTWEAKTGITEPIIESIMIGTQMHQGISFVSRGRVVKGSYSED